MRNKEKPKRVRRFSAKEAAWFELQADICQTLGNAKRLQILTLLKDGEMSVGELVEALGAATPNISQHLALMRQKGILATRREGTTVYYRLATPRILEACGVMRQVLAQALAVRSAGSVPEAAAPASGSPAPPSPPAGEN